VDALRRDIRFEGKMRVHIRTSPQGVPCDYQVISSSMPRDLAFAKCVEDVFFATDYPQRGATCFDVEVPLNFRRTP
jgi:hypothetical protein